jgi:hypothetical protein
MDSSSLETPSNSFSKNTFFNHVFSSTEEGKAEIMNITQYSIMGIVPIVILNKLIHRFIPDADDNKSSLEILAEILIQIIVMFVGVVLIHRIVTYFPTYSEYKYESLSLTNVVLAFLIIILSIQTKLGMKVNILFDRIMDLWNGTSNASVDHSQKKERRRGGGSNSHGSSRADQYMESQSIVPDMITAPMATQQSQSYDIRNGLTSQSYNEPVGMADPMPANSFGSIF